MAINIKTIKTTEKRISFFCFLCMSKGQVKNGKTKLNKIHFLITFEKSILL